MPTSLRDNRILLSFLFAGTILQASCAGEPAFTTADENAEESVQSALEGDPPLVSFEAGTVGFKDFSEGTEKSFGIFVCITGDEVELQSVEAMSTDGEIEVLGAILYEADDAFVGAIDDYPPRGLDEEFITEIPGAVVVTKCDSETRSQVVVGAARTGAGGGKIDGIRISYQGGALEVSDYSIILCGDDGEYCENIDSRANPGSSRSEEQL